MESDKDIRIASVNVADSEVHADEVSYSANVTDMDGNKQVIHDKIGLYVNTSERAMALDGCAAVSSPPEQLVLLTSCVQQ